VPGARKVPWTLLAALLLSLEACTTIDPGSNYSIAPDSFDADYFYCHVEPEFIFAKNCGPGDPGDNSSCHFSAAVNGMNLVDHPAIDCGGGDHPLVSATGVGSTGPSSAAATNLTAVSIQMTRDYMMAPLFLHPTAQAAHPRKIFDPSDATVRALLSTWASK
jgi:hypothetical protein